MVAGVGLGELRELAACCPVEITAVYDNAAEGRSVTADEFGCAMYYDINAEFNGTEQERRSKGSVNDNGDIVAMGDLNEALNVDNI